MFIESNTASIEPKTDIEPFIPYIQGINSFKPFCLVDLVKMEMEFLEKTQMATLIQK